VSCPKAVAAATTNNDKRSAFVRETSTAVMSGFASPLILFSNPGRRRSISCHLQLSSLL
jgi:hypothetical protein